jgi:gas vesicle protein GvpA/GvpJ/GvpM family
MERVPAVSGTTNLLDILDRVLDKGLVIAGDVRVSLANVELLTIRVRLLICSVDKAEQIGLNWWRNDPRLNMAAAAALSGNSEVEARLARIEEQLTRLAATTQPAVSSHAKSSRKS